MINRNVRLVIDRSRVDLQFQLAEHNRMNFSWKTKMLRCEGYAKMWLYEKTVAKRAALEVVAGLGDVAEGQRPERSEPVRIGGVATQGPVRSHATDPRSRPRQSTTYGRQAGTLRGSCAWVSTGTPAIRGRTRRCGGALSAVRCG